MKMNTVYRAMSPEEMSALVMMSVHDEAEFTRLVGFVPNSEVGRFRRAAGGLMVAAMFWSAQYWRLRSCRESCAAALLAAEDDGAMVAAAHRLAEAESLLAGADEALDAFAVARGVTSAALRRFAQADGFEPMTFEPACAELRDTLLTAMLRF